MCVFAGRKTVDKLKLSKQDERVFRHDQESFFFKQTLGICLASKNTCTYLIFHTCFFLSKLIFLIGKPLHKRPID